MINKAFVIFVNLLIFSCPLQTEYGHSFIGFEELPTQAKAFVRVVFQPVCPKSADFRDAVQS
jgi:hypothetical protein